MAARKAKGPHPEDTPDKPKGWFWGRIARADQSFRTKERAVELGVEAGLNAEDIEAGWDAEPVIRISDDGRFKYAPMMAVA